MKNQFTFLLAAVFYLTASNIVLAQLDPQENSGDWEFSADISLQMRSFTQSVLWPQQDTSDLQGSVSIEPEIRWQSHDRSHRLAFVPFYRWDDTDSERSHGDIREAYWAYQKGGVELLVGINKVFWGVTESVHLVNIINQTDFVEDIDQEDKLGQPMLKLLWEQDWGSLDLYVLPYFRERRYPGIEGRLRTPLPIKWDESVFESGAEEKHVDLALRYSHYIGDMDIGLYYFNGTNREARLQAAVSESALIPVYDQIEQLGLDAQYTADAWLWKLEVIGRKGYDDDFIAAVGGFEYTFYQVAETDIDVGWLVEYQYDNRNNTEPVSQADDDFFLGSRVAWNDQQDTSILVGVVVDTNTDETFFNLEAERRFGESTVIELRIRAIDHSEPGELTYSFHRDDYIQLQVSSYF